MKITQISVFLENRKGRLYDVCSLLGANSVNIRALTIAETESFGVLRMVVDKCDAAVRLLRDHGFVANFTDVVAVEVPDNPGGLAAVLKIFADNDVNVEYMYGFVEKHSDKALLVFRFEDTDVAQRVLAKHSISIVTRNEIEGGRSSPPVCRRGRRSGPRPHLFETEPADGYTFLEQRD